MNERHEPNKWNEWRIREIATRAIERFPNDEKRARKAIDAEIGDDHDLMLEMMKPIIKGGAAHFRLVNGRDACDGDELIAWLKDHPAEINAFLERNPKVRDAPPG